MINDSRSEWKDVLSGIPQGSVLGPVLLVIYINSMTNTVKSKLCLFADELYREITSNKGVELLQEDLRKLEEWSKNSLLHFNEDKCVQMIISNGGSNRETSSNELYDKQLETVEEEKYLGVIINILNSPLILISLQKLKRQILSMQFLRKHSLK